MTLRSLQTAGQVAARVGDATRQIAQNAGTAFRDLLTDHDNSTASIGDASATGSSSGNQVSTTELRQQISDLAERVLQSLGISLDQPLHLTATEQGRLQLDGSHPRAAEAEMALQDNPQLVDLVRQLAASADAAARHLVLHRVPGDAPTGGLPPAPA